MATVSGPKGLYACYCLVSKNPSQPGAAYIGFTNNPQHRIRQHNREISGGAKKTSRKGPWRMVLFVSGFPTKVAALKFEYVWTYPNRSRYVSYFTNFEPVAGRAHVTNPRNIRGVLATLLLLLTNAPFSRQPLCVYFLEADFYQQYREAFKAALPSHIPVTFADLQSLAIEPGFDAPAEYVYARAASQMRPPSDVSLSTAGGQAAPLSASTAPGTICPICLGPLAPANAKCVRCSARFCLRCLAHYFVSFQTETRGTNTVSPMIPTMGTCPACRIHMKWAEVLRARALELHDCRAVWRPAGGDDPGQASNYLPDQATKQSLEHSESPLSSFESSAGDSGEYLQGDEIRSETAAGTLCDSKDDISGSAPPPGPSADTRAHSLGTSRSPRRSVPRGDPPDIVGFSPASAERFISPLADCAGYSPEPLAQFPSPLGAGPLSPTVQLSPLHNRYDALSGPLASLDALDALDYLDSLDDLDAPRAPNVLSASAASDTTGPVTTSAKERQLAGHSQSPSHSESDFTLPAIVRRQTEVDPGPATHEDFLRFLRGEEPQHTLLEAERPRDPDGTKSTSHQGQTSHTGLQIARELPQQANSPTDQGEFHLSDLSGVSRASEAPGASGVSDLSRSEGAPISPPTIKNSPVLEPEQEICSISTGSSITCSETIVLD